MKRNEIHENAQALAVPACLSAALRRQSILEVAIPRFAMQGLPGTSTVEIAAAAGISEAYLFRLFGTKRSLFLAAVEQVFRHVLTTLRAAVEQAVPSERHNALYTSWFIPVLSFREELALPGRC